MKAVNGNVVCERCELPFGMGDEVVVKYAASAFGFIFGDGHPIAGYPSLAGQPASVFHSKCDVSTPTTGKFVSLKELMVNLSQSERQKIYEFLHDSLDCRMGR